MKNEPDYKGFCEHVTEWKKHGIPYGISDLIRLARKYNTPIPDYIRKNRPIHLVFTIKNEGDK